MDAGVREGSYTLKTLSIERLIYFVAIFYPQLFHFQYFTSLNQTIHNRMNTLHQYSTVGEGRLRRSQEGPERQEPDPHTQQQIHPICV